MDIFYLLSRKLPHVKKLLKEAHMTQYSPRQFIQKTVMLSTYLSVGLLVLLFFLFDKMKLNLALLILVVPIVFVVSFFFLLNSPTATISGRLREINKEVVYAGRYILVKLESGTPLFNTLIDASKSFGVSSKYFKEIVDDINTGTPIENALDNARENTPSEKFKLILSELVTSLKTGVDVTDPLRRTLTAISTSQMLEIKEYSKKLNAYIMMYMILAIILPSLGMTIFVIIAAFMSFELTGVFIFVAITALVFVQYMFVGLFKSIRPMVDL